MGGAFFLFSSAEVIEMKLYVVQMKILPGNVPANIQTMKAAFDRAKAAEVDCANLFGLSETVDVHDKHDKRKPQPVEDIVLYFVMLHLGLVYLNNAAKL